MKSIMGIIYTGERDEQLKELTAERAVAAVPFAGRYRLIDFPLSSMVDSGIRNVGVITQKNYSSLMDHLGSGREWDLHGKRAGLVFLPPFLTKDNVGVYSGFLDALHANLHYLRHSKERYVVSTDTHMLFAARFDALADFHEKSGADITLLYTKDPGARRAGRGRYIQVEEDGRVSALEIDPTIARLPNIYLETMCIRRELLISLVDEAVSQGHYHLTRDLLMHAEMLNRETRAGLFPADRPVLTKLRDEMPSRYIEGAKVTHSLIADGCVVEGTVENSILFRGVHIEKGAVVRDSIIMQDGLVKSGAELQYCILDKQATVLEGTKLLAPKSYPIVVAKNLTV